MAWFPLGAGVVSAAFALIILQRFIARRGPHQLAWTIALAMFSAASLAAARGISAGWGSGTYRTFYLLGAVTNVPLLALGTIYLIGPRKVGHVAAVAVAAGCLYAAGAVFSADISRQAVGIRSSIPQAAKVMPAAVRSLSRYFSFTGLFVVVGGALWSAWRLSRSENEDAQVVDRLRRVSAGNVLIALGTFVVAAASIFMRHGAGEVFSVGLLIGITTMFWGFMKTRSP